MIFGIISYIKNVIQTTEGKKNLEYIYLVYTRFFASL